MSESPLSLEQRITRLEDIEAIKQLKARWWFACDARDIATMRSCYNEADFLIDFGFIGRYTDMDEFIAVFESLACFPSHIDMHHGTAPEITVHSERHASGRWRMRFQLLESEKQQIQLMSGTYVDEYVKTDSGWKMSVSCYTLESNLFLSAENGTLSLQQIGREPGLVTETAP